MQFGLSMFITDETITPVALGRAAEDAGFDSIFVPEHTHIPASRESAWPGGDELPREYSHTLDPFVSLSAIAATTERLRVGTGIALIVERDPIMLAHEAASLDHLSGGRFELGIGAGWNLEEMRNHGTDPSAPLRGHARARAGHARDLDRGRGLLPRRVRRLRSHLVVAQAGAEPAAGVDRRHRPAGARPRPRVRRRLVSQHARPRRARRRASPSCSGAPPTRAASASRSPTSACATPTTRSSRRWPPAGVDRVLLMLPPAGADETLPRLERYAELAARHR